MTGTLTIYSQRSLLTLINSVNNKPRHHVQGCCNIQLLD